MNYKVLHKQVSQNTQMWKDAVAFAIENDFHGLHSNVIIVAHEFEIIRGVIGIDLIVDIEPLISPHHPVITKHLYDFAMDYIKSNYKVDKVEARVSDKRLDKVKELYEKVGFVLISKANRFVKSLIK